MVWTALISRIRDIKNPYKILTEKAEANVFLERRGPM
jgi:hypothetical protein